MPYFMIQVCYSSGAVKSMTDNPQDRSEIVRKSIESNGGKLHGLYFSFGAYDVVLIAEMPSAKAAAAMAMTVSATGAVSRYMTTPLLTSIEAKEAMAAAKSIAYSAPH